MVVLAAGEEKIVSNAGIRQVAARLAEVKYLEVDGAYHEILMETDDIRAVFWREFDTLAASVSAGSISPNV